MVSEGTAGKDPPPRTAERCGLHRPQRGRWFRRGSPQGAEALGSPCAPHARTSLGTDIPSYGCADLPGGAERARRGRARNAIWTLARSSSGAGHTVASLLVLTCAAVAVAVAVWALWEGWQPAPPLPEETPVVDNPSIHIPRAGLIIWVTAGSDEDVVPSTVSVIVWILSRRPADRGSG